MFLRMCGRPLPYIERHARKFSRGVKPKMGARGPTKKTGRAGGTHGNPGHRKTEKQIAIFKTGKVPSPPVFLNKIAKKEWKRLAPIVFNAGMLTDADVGTFAAYCDSYAQWVLAEKAIQAKTTGQKFSCTADVYHRQRV